MEHSVMTPVILFVCLFGISLTAMVERQYRITANNYRISSGFAEYENEQYIYCFIHCAREPSCYYVSYNNDRRRCQLSDKTNGIDSMEREIGWNLFQIDEECPMSDDDFTTVGNHTIALCSRRLIKSDAERACTNFGGRLLEIRTEEVFHEITGFLLNLPTVRNALYGKFWVAGEYNSTTSTYELPDGSPLPLTSATEHEMDASNECAVLDHVVDYLWHDKPCDKGRSYICEKP